MGTTKTQNKKKSAEVINRNVSSITDLASYQGAESNKEVYYDGLTVSKYYTITDRGEVYINKKTVNANRSADGRIILVPNDIEGYFIEDELGKRTLNGELAGYEITKDGDVVVVPNNPLMMNFQLVA